MSDVDEKQCISCTFGCGQQVSFEYRNFSNGYSYLIYRDFDDDNFHDCPKIPHHELNWTRNSSEIIIELQNQGMDIKNEVNNSEFKKLFWRNEEFHSVNMIISDDESENTESEKRELRRSLEASKVMCSILPIPFFRLFQSRESNTTYLLTKLAEKYQKNGDYDDASIALTIQNEITHDQTDRIIELQNIIAKKSNMPELDPVQDVLEKIYSNFSSKLEQENEFEKIKREKMNYLHEKVEADRVKMHYLKQKEEDIKKMDWKKFKTETDEMLGRVNKDKRWTDKVFEFNQNNKTFETGKKVNKLIKIFEEKWDVIPKELEDWKIENKKQFEDFTETFKSSEESLNQNSIRVNSVSKIREKIRKVERMLKSFAIESFDNDLNEFKNTFPEICRNAEIERENTMRDTLDVPEGNLTDHITLGTIIFIITNIKWATYFPKWIFTYNSYLYNIKSFRNSIDHYTGENEEEFFSNKDKVLVDISCDKILNLLNKINTI